MRLREVILEDVAAYAGGPHVFRFPESDESEASGPIILIHGQNGAGKTTFLNSILLGIHGARALGPGVSRKQYLQRLQDLIPHKSPESKARVSVELVFQPKEGAAEIFRAERSWWMEGASIREAFEVHLDGIQLDEDSFYRWDVFSQSQFPATLAPLFIFDAERSGELLGLQAAGGAASAYSRVHGLDVAEQLVGDLKKLHADLVKSSMEVDELSQLRDLEGELEVKHQEWRAATEDAARVQGVLGSVTSRREALEIQLEADFQEVAEERSALRASIAAAQAEQQSNSSDLIERWSGALPVALCPTLAKRTVSSLRADSVALDPNVVIRAIERAADYLHEEGEGTPSGFEESIQALVRAVTAQDSERNVIHRLPFEDYAPALDLLERQLRNECDVAVELVHRNDAAVKQGEMAEARMRRMGNDVELRSILEQARRIAAEEGQIQESLHATRARVEAAWRDKAEIELNIGDLEAQAAARETEDDPLARVWRALQASEAYLRRLREAKAKQLGESIRISFNQLSRKGELLESVSVDERTGAIVSLQSKFREDLSTEAMSAGEQQVLALSYLWALIRTDGRDFPVVIDTPFGRLDSEHRRNIVRRFLAQDLGQVVLLVTDEEATSGFMDDFGNEIAGQHWLSHDPQEGVTSVHGAVKELAS